MRDGVTTLEEVVRVDDLISQFINFARPEGAASWQKVNVSEILTGVIRLVRKELESKQLETQLNINENLPPVWADERSLRQVFLNVLLNARDLRSGIGSPGVVSMAPYVTRRTSPRSSSPTTPYPVVPIPGSIPKTTICAWPIQVAPVLLR